MGRGIAHRDHGVGVRDEGASGREPAATGARGEVVEHSGTVGNDIGAVAEAFDDPQDLARPDLRPRTRVGQPGHDAQGGARLQQHAVIELAASVLDRVDRGAYVRLDRQLQPGGDRGSHVVGVDQHDARPAAHGPGQLDRDLGSPRARAAAHRHEAASSHRRHRKPRPKLVFPQSCDARDRAHEGVRPGVGIDQNVDAQRHQVFAARRLLGIVHADDRPAQRVHVDD